MLLVSRFAGWIHGGIRTNVSNKNVSGSFLPFMIHKTNTLNLTKPGASSLKLYGGMSDTSPLYFGVLIYTDEVLIKSSIKTFSSTIATQQSTGNTRHLKGQSKKTILPAGSVAKVKSPYQWDAKLLFDGESQSIV